MSDLDELTGGLENSITLTTEDGEEETFYVLEETVQNGRTYLLVSDSREGDGECFLLRDKSNPEDAEASFEFVDDDGELEYMARVFQELLRDLGVEIE
mgnify:FL=1